MGQRSVAVGPLSYGAAQLCRSAVMGQRSVAMGPRSYGAARLWGSAVLLWGSPSMGHTPPFLGRPTDTVEVPCEEEEDGPAHTGGTPPQTPPTPSPAPHKCGAAP